MALVALATPPAWAQEYEDLDSTGKAKKSEDTVEGRKESEVREIEKGTYAKANVGGALYLGSFNTFVSPGTSLALAVGRDFVDREDRSMAWEVAFFQGIHNGMHFEEQALVSGAPLVQGDLRTYTFALLGEWATYPSRRVGLGVRAGGGVLLSPLLMDEAFYQEDVVIGAWGGQDPSYHKQPHPVVIGGPNVEYYTKLSHFSVGADVDVFYAVGFDLGTSVTLALKYTF
jgi:hypothetical protein